jgi:RNA polymerase sigma-70 factor (ECF subfamily)
MTEALAIRYVAARPRLLRVAYAILGSHAEAEDVVSDCWLRLVDAHQGEPIEDVDAWSTVVVARRALDVLRSARRRRETYIGPWLPEPLVDAAPALSDPADRVTLDDSLSYALLVALEALSAAERTSWVLHDLFGLPFAEVAEAVGRTPAAVRQLAARARRHVSDGAPRLHVDTAEHEATFRAFVAAAAGGDLGALVALLDPDVVLTSDGGGIVSAARRPVYGADRVARFLLGIIRKTRPSQRTVPITVNGAAGLALMDGAQVEAVFSLTVNNGRVKRLDLVRAPAKLSHVRIDR